LKRREKRVEKKSTQEFEITKAGCLDYKEFYSNMSPKNLKVISLHQPLVLLRFLLLSSSQASLNFLNFKLSKLGSRATKYYGNY
jgi:hypothetical protein